MTPREIAEWLNTESTDEEFLETFALFYKAIYGRGIPTEYDSKALVEDMNINLFCNELRKVLEDIREEILERK
jgi:hypothetical protein